MKKIIFIQFSLLFYFSSLAQYESFFGKNSTSYSQFYTYGWWNKSAVDRDNLDRNLSSIIGVGYTFDSYFTKEDTIRIHDILYYKTSYIPNTNTNAPETY
jgi:hypothetical protein